MENLEAIDLKIIFRLDDRPLNYRRHLQRLVSLQSQIRTLARQGRRRRQSPAATSVTPPGEEPARGARGGGERRKRGCTYRRGTWRSEAAVVKLGFERGKVRREGRVFL
ncbi:unnamed protein product [Rhodiola kirilowii]